MKRSTNQRDASANYRDAESQGEPLPVASSLFHTLAARVWDEVTDGAGVVHVRTLNAEQEKAAERVYMRGVDSAERARLARHARLKKEAAEAKKKGGEP